MDEQNTTYVAPAGVVVGTLTELTASKGGPFADFNGGNDSDIDFPSSILSGAPRP